jgi:hypothetical protein
MTDLNNILQNRSDMAAMDSAPALAGTGIMKEPTMQATLEALGETMGQWKQYDSQLPIADIAGTRITKALYKTNNKTGTIAGTNSYARIPTKHLTIASVIEQAEKLAPYVLDYLQGIETLMLKEQHKNGQLNIFTDGLSINRLINKLDESSENSRLSKVDIEAWFDASISEPLTMLFADKMGIDEDSDESVLAKLEKKIMAYKAKFASLAAPKPFIKEADCIALISVIEKCEVDEDTRSLLGGRFITKLAGMHKDNDDILEAL